MDFKCWVTEYIYLVQGHLCDRTVLLQIQVLCRVPKFCQRLFESPLKEVKLVAGYAQSVLTGNQTSGTLSVEEKKLESVGIFVRPLSV